MALTEEKRTTRRWLDEDARTRLSTVLAALMLVSAALWSLARRWVLAPLAAAGRGLVGATGWWTEHLSRGLPRIGRSCTDAVGWCSHQLAAVLPAAANRSVDGLGWATRHIAGGLPAGLRMGATGVGRYVDWWSRAAPAAGRALVTATGRSQAALIGFTRRFVPSFAGLMSVAAATVTWVVVVVAATVPAAGGYGDVVTVDFAVPDDTSLPSLAQRSVVYAADGSVLAVLHDEQDRRVVTLDSLPDHVWQAAVAAEDRRFFEHEGYDVEAITRAFVANVQAGDIVQGGSTITQQLAKQNFLTDEQTMQRKAQELTYAMALEERLSKEQLLERYLNQVYFGSGAYGVAAAAEEWFAVPPEKLTLEQAALLAGMIRAPGRLNPRDNPDAAKARRDMVLRAMAEEGYISAARAEEAVQVGAPVMPRRDRDVSEPFVVEAVKKEFFENPAFGEDRGARIEYLFNGGLEIHTTIDPRMQRLAHEAVESHYPSSHERTAALASVDPRDGRVVATHSGADFEAEQFDLATQGRRQAGSAFKVFVLATALEQGRSVYSPISGKAPRSFDWDPHQEPWTVNNFGGASYGTLSLHEALVRSVNTAFAELMLKVGPSYVVEMAQRLGIDPRAFGPLSAQGPAIALGGLDEGVTPLEMASAFGTFAANGARAEPYLIESVAGPDGQEVFRHEPQRQRVVSPQTAGTMIDAMKAVVSRGTGTRAQLAGWQVAGKTGTSQVFADAWFVGTTPVLSTAVWVGHPERRVTYPRMTGGQFAAPVWRDFMSAALEGVPPEPFPVPPPPAPPQPPARAGD